MDKLSDHYTSAEGYRDLDGLHKQFTFIDHDIKSKYTSPPLKEEEVISLRAEVSAQIRRDIDEILVFPAVSVMKEYQAEDFVERTPHSIEWRESVVRDALSINHTLRHNIKNTVWKNTVSPQYWFEDMSHEDIMAEKWRHWMH